jgi:hypothetical protein
MTLLTSIQEDYSLIHKVVLKFLSMLSGKNYQADIVITAELAGLLLLRASKQDLSKSTPGTMLLGAVADETYLTMNQYIFEWSACNGLKAMKTVDDIEIPEEFKGYHPEVVTGEADFLKLCRENSIREEYFPYVAMTTALMIASFAQDKKIQEGKVSVSVIIYHLILGSKTVPFLIK